MRAHAKVDCEAHRVNAPEPFQGAFHVRGVSKHLQKSENYPMSSLQSRFGTAILQFFLGFQ